MSDAPADRSPGNELASAVGAFVQLVAERGYQNVELSEIDERAGLASGRAERLLPDRLSYFQAGWEMLEAQFVTRLRRVYEQEKGWRDQLRAAAREAGRLLETYPAQAHYLAVDALSVGEEGRARQQALATRLAVFLDQARAESDHTPNAPAATSGWVMALFFDRVYRFSATGNEDQFARELPELMFLAVSAYFGPDAGLAELREEGS